MHPGSPANQCKNRNFAENTLPYHGKKSSADIGR